MDRSIVIKLQKKYKSKRDKNTTLKDLNSDLFSTKKSMLPGYYITNIQLK